RAEWPWLFLYHLIANVKIRCGHRTCSERFKCRRRPNRYINDCWCTRLQKYWDNCPWQPVPRPRRYGWRWPPLRVRRGARSALPARPLLRGSRRRINHHPPAHDANPTYRHPACRLKTFSVHLNSSPRRCSSAATSCTRTLRRYSSCTFSVPRSFSWKMSSRRRRSLVHLEKSQAKVFTRPFLLNAHPPLDEVCG